MLTSLVDIASLCVSVAGDQAPTLIGLLLAGLAGSLTHCVGMCGPFVVSQTGARLAQSPLSGRGVIMRRLRAASLVSYHLGRITTYALLGAVLSIPIAKLTRVGDWWWLAPTMLTLAAALFAMTAIGLLHLGSGAPWGQRFGQILARIGRPLFTEPKGAKGYVLGLLLGLLPCGLVYAALVAATAVGDPLVAVMGMAAFGLGTIPSLFVVAYGGAWFLPKIGVDLRRLAPYLVLGNAAFLVFAALRLVFTA